MGVLLRDSSRRGGDTVGDEVGWTGMYYVHKHRGHIVGWSINISDDCHSGNRLVLFGVP